MLHAFLAEAPAEIDLAAFAQGGKIHQSDAQILDVDSQVLNLMRQLIEPLKIEIESTQFGAASIADAALDGGPEFGLARQHVRADAENLLHHRAQEGQCFVGFFQGEISGHSEKYNR